MAENRVAAEPDVILVGPGPMNSTSGMLLKELGVPAVHRWAYRVSFALRQA